MAFGREEGVGQDCQQDDRGDVLNEARTPKAKRSLTNAGVAGQIFFQIFETVATLQSIVTPFRVVDGG